MPARGRERLCGRIDRPFQGKARPDAGDTSPGPLEVALPLHAEASPRRPIPRLPPPQAALGFCRANPRRQAPETDSRAPLRTARRARLASLLETDIRNAL